MRLRLGARGSALSLVQARLVAAALEGLAGIESVEIVEVRTTGDRLSATGAPIGWKGDFTRELDEALWARSIDLAVHSLKDIPAVLPDGLALAAVPRREDPRDALISHPRRLFSELPSGARVGTSSPRRRAQLLAARPDLSVGEARGNVDTRLRRLLEGKWDAIVLARAGLARLGKTEEVVELFSDQVMLPAPGQGALGVVSRAADADLRKALEALDDHPSRSEVLAERSLLARLQAGCRAPVAALARSGGTSLSLDAAVFSADGSRCLRERATGTVEGAERLGTDLADRLLARGAAALIGEAS